MNWKYSLYVSAESFYFHSAVSLLVITAISKLISVAGEATVLAMADPVFRIVSLRQLLLVTALLELAVAGYAWKGRDSATKSFLILWLCSIFLVYRFGLWLMNYKGCSCLGTVTQWMPVSPATVDLMMKIVLAYLTTGSAIFFCQSLIKEGTNKGAERRAAG